MSSEVCRQMEGPLVYKKLDVVRPAKMAVLNPMPVSPDLERKARRIATLLVGYMRETLTHEEHDELDEWVGSSDKNMRLFEELTDENRIALAFQLLNSHEPMVKKLATEHYKFGNPPLLTRVRNFLLLRFGVNV